MKTEVSQQSALDGKGPEWEGLHGREGQDSETWDEILGHAPCYSQSLLLRILQKTIL